jgi:nucleoside-diphosphate-sugar epimerase
LLDENGDAYRAPFNGADAVPHCDFTRAAKPEDRFFAELANVKMAYIVYQTCIEEGVRRAVVITSNHAADYYEKLIWSDRMDYVTPDMVPLSDNFYGWAKASYELLGFAFATGNDSDGKPLEMVQPASGAARV